MLWDQHTQRKCAHLYNVELKDVFVFKFKDSGKFFALERKDPVALSVVMESADVVYYADQRLRHIPEGFIKWE